MGSVQKQVRTLKSGKQAVSWVARWREPGTTRQPGKSFPKKGLAEAFLREGEADILRGEYIAKDSDKVTFGGAGANHQIFEDKFYEVTVNGVRLVDWLDALITDEPPDDVHCDHCDP
jgi:hypothetical protein